MNRKISFLDRWSWFKFNNLGLTLYGLGILHRCGKSGKTKNQKVLGANSYACRSHKRKSLNFFNPFLYTEWLFKINQCQIRILNREFLLQVHLFLLRGTSQKQLVVICYIFMIDSYCFLNVAWVFLLFERISLCYSIYKSFKTINLTCVSLHLPILLI